MKNAKPVTVPAPAKIDAIALDKVTGGAWNWNGTANTGTTSGWTAWNGKQSWWS